MLRAIIQKESRKFSALNANFADGFRVYSLEDIFEERLEIEQGMQQQVILLYKLFKTVCITTIERHEFPPAIYSSG
jgi:hypothetical protein